MVNSWFSDKRAAIIPYAVALITFLVFSPTLWHDFINYDDPAFILDNPAVRAGITWEGLIWAFTTGYQGNWIPLTWLSHMLDVQLFGFDSATGHHFVSVLLHTASTVLLYRFLHLVTTAPWKSAAVAILFALHPLHVESVAWVAERKDVLSTFFCMLTLNAYAGYARAPSFARYLRTLLLFVCGILAKSMLVSLPLLLLLLDYWPLGRLQRTPRWRLLWEKIPFMLFASGAALATFSAHSGIGAIADSFTLTARVGKAALAYVAYLGKMVWPTKLAIIYTFSLYPPRLQVVLAAVTFLVLISAAVICLRRKHPYLAVGWLWYCISLIPVCGIVQIGVHSIADRYTYLPLIGIFCMIAWGMPELWAKLRLPQAVILPVAFAIMTTMTVLTLLQVRRWQDSITLFSHTVAVTEKNWVAHAGLGLALFNLGKEEEAIQQYLEALEAKPSYVFAQLNLGYAYFRRGDLDEAIDCYMKVSKREPDNAVAHLNLGFLYLNTGRIEAARTEYQRLLDLHPEYAAELMRAIVSRKEHPQGQKGGQRL